MDERIAEEIDRIAVEIDRLEHQWNSLLRERHGSRRLPARWTFSRRALRWHVVLEDVLEPDIDVELLPDVLVVRARPQGHENLLLMGLLPIPPEFEAERARIRVARDYLEVVVLRRSGRGGRR